MKREKTKINFGLSKILLKNIKDCIFPVFCLGCETEGVWLCDNCERTIDLKGVFCCPVCHQQTVGGVCCERCRSESDLQSQIAMTPYREEMLIGKLIVALKYQYAEEVKIVFANLINQFVLNQPEVLRGADLVAPVPLHRKRFAERGYNQAEIIADILARRLNLPLKNVLKRSRATKQQAKLKKEERLVNLRNAFCLKDNADIKGKKILLVDDVYTTGSTMGECAEVLKNAGASEVRGFSMARG